VVSDPPARLLLGLAGLTAGGVLAAVTGQYWAAFLALAAACAWLLTVGIREIRNRRWAARVARWDRPEVWRILDAVRDREAQRDRDREAWARLTGQLAALAVGLAAGFPGVLVDVDRTVARIVGTFDGRFVGFGDRLAGEEQPPPPVRYL